MAFGVATSVPCRDIISCFWRLQLVAFDVATSVPCRDIILDEKPVIASRRFSCHDLHSLSRHQPLSRHHDAVATLFIKFLVNPQLPNL